MLIQVIQVIQILDLYQLSGLRQLIRDWICISKIDLYSAQVSSPALSAQHKGLIQVMQIELPYVLST